MVKVLPYFNTGTQNLGNSHPSPWMNRAKVIAKTALIIFGGGTIIAMVMAATREGLSTTLDQKNWTHLPESNLPPFFSGEPSEVLHFQKRGCASDVCAFATGTVKVVKPTVNAPVSHCLTTGPTDQEYFLGVVDSAANSYYGKNGVLASTPAVSGAGTLISGTYKNSCTKLSSGNYLSISIYWTLNTNRIINMDTRIYNSNGVFVSGRTDSIGALGSAVPGVLSQSVIFPSATAGKAVVCINTYPGAHEPLAILVDGVNAPTFISLNFEDSTTLTAGNFANGKWYVAAGKQGTQPQVIATVLSSSGSTSVANTAIFNGVVTALSSAVLTDSQNIVFAWISDSGAVQFQIYSSSLVVQSAVQTINPCASSPSDIQMYPLASGGFTTAITTSSGIKVSRFSAAGVEIDGPIAPIAGVTGTQTKPYMTTYDSRAVRLALSNGTAVHISGPLVFDTAPKAASSFSLGAFPNTPVSLNLTDAFIVESPVGTKVFTGPLGATFDVSSNIVSWTPMPTDRGNGTMSLQVTDQYGKSGTLSFPYSVGSLPIQVNDTFSAIEAYSLTSGNYTLPSIFNGPYGDAVQLSAAPLPPGVTFVGGTFYWTLPARAQGNTTVTVTGTDYNSGAVLAGVLPASSTIAFSVPNREPAYVEQLPNRIFPLGKLTTFTLPSDLKTSDPDGDAVQVSLDPSMPSWLTLNPSTLLVSAQPIVDTGIIQFPVAIRLTDPHLKSSIVAFNATTENVPPVPQSPSVDISLKTGSSFTLPLPNLFQGGFAPFSYEVFGVPPGIEMVGTSLVGSSSAAGLYHGNVTVTDRFDEKTLVDLNWNVTSTSTPTVGKPFSTNTPGSLIAPEGSFFSQNVRSFFSDIPGLKFSFSSEPEAPWLSLDENGLLFGTPGHGDIANLKITIKATTPEGVSKTVTAPLAVIGLTWIQYIFSIVSPVAAVTTGAGGLYWRNRHKINPWVTNKWQTMLGKKPTPDQVSSIALDVMKQ